MTEVFAHRGSAHVARENTLEAFAAARKLGADGVELDVHLTADGVVVVHHDAQVPGVGPLARLRSVELPTWMPSLPQALEACRPLAVNVEIKQDDEGARQPSGTWNCRCGGDPAGELDEAPSVLVSSFSLAAIDAVRSLRPDLATALLADVDADPMEALVTAREHGHGGLHPFFTCVDAGLMTAAKDCGMAIRTWTVDDGTRIAALAALGVDAVITNDVATALRALGRFRRAAEPPSGGRLGGA